MRLETADQLRDAELRVVSSREGAERERARGAISPSRCGLLATDIPNTRGRSQLGVSQLHCSLRLTSPSDKPELARINEGG